MPRIKAYKGNGCIIPVDAAKISTVFSCPWTSKLFSNKRDYVKHLADLRLNRIHRRIRDNAHYKKIEDLWSQPSFDKIIEWINRNPEFIFENGLRQGWGDQEVEKFRDTYWLRITYLNLNWNDRVSNTHVCPRDGVTNWGGREYYKDGTPKPRGYPGWSGRIEWQTSHELRFGGDPLQNLCIHTGTGGSGSKNRFGYDVKFFESDWPGLRQSTVFDKLSENDASKSYLYGLPHYFR